MLPFSKIINRFILLPGFLNQSLRRSGAEENISSNMAPAEPARSAEPIARQQAEWHGVLQPCLCSLETLYLTYTVA